MVPSASYSIALRTISVSHLELQLYHMFIFSKMDKLGIPE